MNKKPPALFVDEEESSTTRREFLKTMAAAGTATLMANEPKLLRAADETGAVVQHPRARADACILLWMAGGMAAPETFDPKHYEPFQIGVPVERVMSTFPAIDTVVDNIKISQGLEHVAQVLDRGTLIRTHVLPDLGHILHSRHQYHWHTGYVPPQTVAAPAYRSVDVARVGADQPGDAGVHQYWPAAGRSRRVGGGEGVHDRRAFSAANTARSICPSRKMRRWRCGRPRGWKPGDLKTDTGFIGR